MEASLLNTVPLTRAAQYVRMSTDHQTFSIEYQSVANSLYAVAQGYEIVRTFTDAGISGVTFEKRPGLKELLSDVLGGTAEFEVVLVYDVSRWGRFQDPDQAAHYEFLCREAGVRIEYTSEPFSNDGSLTASLVKQLKRAMAAEYSRELSAKVTRAQTGLRAKGYWMGGPCGYGLRRQALTPSGQPGPIMEAGERMGIQGYRSVIVPGPASEVAMVRRIFRLYVVEGLTEVSIAERLNGEGVPAAAGAKWTRFRVRSLLGNEAYVGTLVGAKQTQLLQQHKMKRREDWIRVKGAITPLISQSWFDMAARNLRKHQPKVSDETLVDELKSVLARHGRLSRKLIEDDPKIHCASVFFNRFGGLLGAYARAGYVPDPAQARAAATALEHRPSSHMVRQAPKADEELLEPLRALLRARGALSVEIINWARGVPGAEIYRDHFGGMRRVYALVGYEPTEHQDTLMDIRGGQSLDRAGAQELRKAVLAAQRVEPDGGERP